MLALLKFRDIGYVLVIAALFGLWQYERASHARMLLAIENANKELTNKAADLAYKLEQEQTDRLAKADAKSVVFIDRIVHVKGPDNACANDERMQLGTDGVRGIITGQDRDTKTKR